MSNKRNLAMACALLILIGGIYYFFWGGSATDSANSPSTPSQAPLNLTFSGSSIVEEEDGKKLWELNADTIEAAPTGNTIYLNNLKGTFYREKDGKIEIIANRATLDTKTRDISMQGNIKATNSNGAVFMAPEAWWSGEPKHFTGVGGVTLTRGDTTITGEKLETDDKMEKFKIYGNAKVVTGGKN